jgi:maltose alpha-D-glucosyltransferase/alpha-amylase
MNSGDPLWYKDAIIYELHVKAFFDANDDGIGDFAGLTRKLDYLESLGVTALWLLPFYPSPLRDDGYDIADYKDIHPAYGTLRDFRQFVRAAHARGMRVITELVINHTSDQHPWFQRARKAGPGSAWRNFYVWSDSDQKYSGTRIIFSDTETSNWAWDPEAKAYYWHRFFAHQPDLNFDNPRVMKAVKSAMKFWLDAGVDGVRLDAIPYLVERDGTDNTNLAETHGVVKHLRAWLDARFTDRMFLAEANQWPEDVRPYFGDGDECHMAFHFPLMPRIYMALAQEDRHPITDILRQTPDIPESCQWAIFLRNHDELTLEMVTDRERDYLWRFYAADPRARINGGIRRRLAPLLDNDRNKIELLNSLLLSMPGTPVLYYGDELGMGDNIFLGDRDGVRTPMQWSPDRNGGFSKADPPQLFLPVIMDPVYGFQAVNVEAQARNPASLLNWVRRMLAVRKAHRAFGRGSLTLLYPGNRKVLAYLRQYEGETILCIVNLSRSAQPAELDLSAYSGRVPVELMGNSAFPPIGELPYFITLPGYAFYWFLLAEQAAAPAWHEDFEQAVPDLLTLVLPQGWASLVSGTPRATLTERILPEYLRHQRWFAGKGRTLAKVDLIDHAELSDPMGGWLMCLIEATFADGSTQRYFLPFAVAWESMAEDPLTRLLPSILCRVRKNARVGVLYDAMADGEMVRRMTAAMAEGGGLTGAAGGRFDFAATIAFPTGLNVRALEVRRLGREQSNISAVVGEEMVLKAYRQVQGGCRPEVEVGLFLTETAGFTHSPQLLGTAEYRAAGGETTALAVLQQFVRNLGDGWSFTLDHLGRHLEDAQILQPPAVGDGDHDPHALFLLMAGRLGERTAELHKAFALDVGNPAFAPEPTRSADLKEWLRQAMGQARDAFTALKRVRALAAPDLQGDIDRLLARRGDVLERLTDLAPGRLDAVRTRLHGDFHLGQVAIVRDDVQILDFEGELSAHPVQLRRTKSSPLRDVAAMLRSFNQAGWAAVFEHAAGRPELMEKLRPLAVEWERRTAETFLGHYHTASDDCPSYPADKEQRARILRLFLFERLFHEIGYEAANRPDWLRIPVAGLTRLLAETEAV